MAAEQQDDQSRQESRRIHPFWDFWGPILFTFALYLGIRHYIVEARYIPSGSMLPGLQVHDRLLVEKLTFRQRKPRRGEIVVFHSPAAFVPALLALSPPPRPLQCAIANIPLVGWFPGVGHPACDAYIKRVIAVEGDRVQVDPQGKARVNGEALDEPYVTKYCKLDLRNWSDCGTITDTVPPGHVLVLGDNRGNSQDGRVWGFLPTDQIIGRAVWRFWPPNRLGTLTD
ncbi:signal peptidase I [Parasynechococcus sp.]|uniref:signal peptidase I n=1 Tax=Parasynechococcus sp. TaxID=3101203 RepID=UPI0037037A29